MVYKKHIFILQNKFVYGGVLNLTLLLIIFGCAHSSLPQKVANSETPKTSTIDSLQYKKGVEHSIEEKLIKKQ